MKKKIKNCRGISTNKVPLNYGRRFTQTMIAQQKDPKNAMPPCKFVDKYE